jgi:hypothetical protein
MSPFRSDLPQGGLMLELCRKTGTFVFDFPRPAWKLLWSPTLGVTRMAVGLL